MKLKASTLILVAFAIVLACCAAFVARSMVAPQTTATGSAPEIAKTEDVPPVAVLIATSSVKPGDFITSAALTWQMVKADAVPAGAVTASTSKRDAERRVIGATVKVPLAAGDAVKGDQLLTSGQPGFIAAVLTPGKRAVSIPTSAVASNSGLVTAGDWVDVILTLERKSAEAMADDKDTTAGLSKIAAQTLLQKVRVLALNSSTAGLAPTGDEKKETPNARTPARRAVYETITLEVTPEDAERLAVAREVGTLQVALRGLRETSDAATKPMARVTRLPEATAVLGDTKAAPRQVTTYQGAQAAVLTF